MLFRSGYDKHIGVLLLQVLVELHIRMEKQLQSFGRADGENVTIKIAIKIKLYGIVDCPW